MEMRMEMEFESGDTAYNTFTDEYLVIIDMNVKDEFSEFIICNNGKKTLAYRKIDLVSIKDFRSIKISQLLVG